jgi:ribosomal protein L13
MLSWMMQATQVVRGALKVFGQILHSDLRGDLAVQVAAHAVGKHHQQRVARVAVGDAVLVVSPLTDAAFLVNGEFHLRKRIFRLWLKLSSQED